RRSSAERSAPWACRAGRGPPGPCCTGVAPAPSSTGRSWSRRRRRLAPGAARILITPRTGLRPPSRGTRSAPAPGPLGSASAPARRRPRPAWWRNGGVASCGPCGSEVGALVELAGAQQLQTLVEENLEFLLAAALEQHVPVGAHGLARLPRGLLGSAPPRGRRVSAQPCGLPAAALPDRRHIGLDGEGKDDGVSVGAVVDGLLTGCGEHSLVGLHG